MWQSYDESGVGFIHLHLSLRMCSCHHNIHWSVVALIVNVIAITLFLTGVATNKWAVKTTSTDTHSTGLFQTCSSLNQTCHDTHVFFNGYSEKTVLMISAVINVFAVIGMFLFLALSIFFICGMFEEKQLATGAVITSYLSGLVAILGTIMFAVTIKSLDFKLSWSFILAVMGFCVNFAAGVLMCVGRNISTSNKKKKKQPSFETQQIEEVRMDETEQKRPWPPGGALP